MEPAPSASMSTNVYVNAPVSGQRNGIGTAGFVVALLGIFLAWIPVAGFIIWILGAIFSLIGIFRRPRELAIAGAAISFSGIFILLLAIVGFASYL